MYLDFYGFKKQPFHITPDLEFLYLSPSHQEALQTILHGVERRVGLVLLTGAVGSGKTTLLRSFLEWVDRDRVQTIFVFHPNLSFKDLLKFMHAELGLELLSEHDVPEMVQSIHRALSDMVRQGRSVVLLIDEAQNLPVETLEQLRTLTNLENNREKLLQILLAGQPELDDLLDRHGLFQIKQRIALRATLDPLTKKESQAYIRHRLSIASLDHTPVFTQGALRLIARASRGIPRKINVICDNVLITGHAHRQQPVRAHVVKDVVARLNGGKGAGHMHWTLVPAAIVILVAGLLLVSFYGGAVLSATMGTDLGAVFRGLIASREQSASQRQDVVNTRQRVLTVPDALLDPQPARAATSMPTAPAHVEEPSVEHTPYGPPSETDMLSAEQVLPHAHTAALAEAAKPDAAVDAVRRAAEDRTRADKDTKRLSASIPDAGLVPLGNDSLATFLEGETQDPADLIEWVINKRSARKKSLP